MLLGVLFGFLSFGTSVHGSVKQSGTTSTRLFENVTSGLSLKNSTSSDVDDLGSRIRRNESVSLNVAQIHLQLREEVSAINLTAANYSFNEDAVRQIQQSVTNYATLISDVAGTHNLSYDTRRAAIESYLGLIVTVADVMGSRRVTTGAVSDSLTNAILHGARALVILQTHASDNHSIAIGVPPSRYIGGGFIEAVHLGASSIQGAPGSQGAQQDAVVYSNTHAAFVLDPRAAFFRRRANVPKFEAVAIVEFSDDSLFPSAENQSRPAWVGSSILSVSLGSPVRDLTDMNQLCGTYVYSVKSNSVPTRSTTSHPGTNLKPKCVYYNHSLLSWRGDGCSLTFANSTHATCCCNHLTSFAVLIEEEEMTTKDSLAIETITWVSVGGSVFFLLLSAFTILGTPELHKQLHYKILLNLIFALASSQITFFFISVPTSTIPCKLVALLLLYTILSALAWMNVEGHELFHTFVRTDVWHHSQSDAALLRRYATVAWGLPLIITLVALVDSDGLISTSETRSSNDTRVDVSISHCWFNPESSIRWVFLAPMLIAVSTGIVFTTIVLWTVMKLLRARKLGKESSVEAVTGRAKVAFMIMSLTGSGWVFGVLMLLKIGLAWTPYAFTIASGGQGVLVFFFHVYPKETGRDFLYSVGTSVFSRHFSHRPDHPPSTVRAKMRNKPLCLNKLRWDRTGKSSMRAESDRVHWRKRTLAAVKRITRKWIVYADSVVQAPPAEPCSVEVPQKCHPVAVYFEPQSPNRRVVASMDLVDHVVPPRESELTLSASSRPSLRERNDGVRFVVCIHDSESPAWETESLTKPCEDRHVEPSNGEHYQLRLDSIDSLDEQTDLSMDYLNSLGAQAAVNWDAQSASSDAKSKKSDVSQSSAIESSGGEVSTKIPPEDVNQEWAPWQSTIVQPTTQ